VSEFVATLRETLAHLAGHDPHLARFGAHRHGYRLAPPLAAERLAAIEAELGVRFPDDYREHVTLAGDGGAGPYHGLMPLDHPIQLGCARGAFDPGEPFRGVVGLCHHGCGYVSVLVLDGPARGQVWLDLRAADDGVVAIAPDFRTYYLGWIDALAHHRWPASHVTPGRCALPHALTSYLHATEDKLGVGRDQLSPDQTREALSRIPDGGIATASAGESPFFGSGDLVDLCVACEQTIENLPGMRRSQTVAGVEPRPRRLDVTGSR
jgi:hypothetical protein